MAAISDFGILAIFEIFSESESEFLFILGQPLAQRATIKVPSEEYNTEHKK